ncbi:hypothetical protein C8Q74DRAFT_277888 [Fomes fomentarius]|nr:hypothetical protein C8Q74DRAFT_277888 [Fomes fomentarius]
MLSLPPISHAARHGWNPYHYTLLFIIYTWLQPPVECKPTWWHPTFASRTAQAPATPNKPYQKYAGREVESQRLSGTVTCRGWVTRTVRRVRGALQG